MRLNLDFTLADSYTITLTMKNYSHFSRLTVCFPPYGPLGTIYKRALHSAGLTGNFYLGCYGSWLTSGYHLFPRLSWLEPRRILLKNKLTRKDVSCII